MLRLFTFASFAALVLAHPKCKPEDFGADARAVFDLGNRESCVCETGGPCDKLTAEVEGDTITYISAFFGTWIVKDKNEHLELADNPRDIKDTISLPINRGDHIVYILCTTGKDPEFNFVEFETKDAATSEVLADLKSKYNIDISEKDLKGC